MKYLRIMTYFISIAFVALAVFGLYLPVYGMGTMDCPFAPGSSSLCDHHFAHLSHWQQMFSAILVDVLVLAAVVVWVLLYRPGVALLALEAGQRGYVRQRDGPDVPSYFQELFATGVLHSRAP